MEFHFRSLKDALSPRIESGEAFVGKRVVVKTVEGKEFQMLWKDKSMGMPFTIHDGADPRINEMARQNLEAVDLKLGDAHVVKVCGMMGFSFSTNNEGLVFQSQNADDATFLHIYPKDPIVGEGEFIEFAKKIFESRGNTFTVAESL